MITHIIATMVDEDGCLTAEGEAELDRLYVSRDEQVGDLLRERGNREAEVAGLRAVIAGLEARVDAEVEAIGRIDRQLERVLRGEKYSCPAGVVSWRKSDVIVISNEDAIGEEWRKVKTVETIDKAGLKKAIKSGLAVSYAYIETRQNMSVK
jgi:hypothetical protein